MRQLTGALVASLLLTAGMVRAQNLITNGDFSSGLTGWSNSAGNVAPQSAGAPFGTVAEIGVGNGVTSLFQSFTLASGSALTVAFDYGSFNPTVQPLAGPWNMDVILTNSGSFTVWNTTVDAFNAGQTGQYRTELSFSDLTASLPSGTYTLTFAPQGHGWTTIDNVRVTASAGGGGGAAPEPGTLSLLSLGLLAIPIRRGVRGRRKDS